MKRSTNQTITAKELMQVIEFNKRRYKLPDTLAEITLNQLIEYGRIEQDMPALMRRYIQADPKDRDSMNDEISQPLEVIAWYRYYRRVVSYWLKADEAQVELMQQQDVMGIYLHFFKTISNYKPKGIKQFEWYDENDEPCTYFFPEQHMKGSTLGEFIESAQWEHHISNVAKGSYEALPYLLAVLCRKKDEPYTDGLDIKRAPAFSDITADIAVELGFFLQIQNLLSLTRSLTFAQSRAGMTSQTLHSDTDGTASSKGSEKAEHSGNTDQGKQTRSARSRQTSGRRSHG